MGSKRSATGRPLEDLIAVRIVRIAEVVSRLATQTGLKIYRRHHINKLVQMVAKVVGAAPHGRIAQLGGALLWRMMRLRAGVEPVTART